MRWLLWCFCLLAESYETINHYHYHQKNYSKLRISLAWHCTGAHYWCFSDFAWFIRLHTLGKTLRQFVYWSIGSCLHPHESHLPFTPVLTTRIVTALPLLDVLVAFLSRKSKPVCKRWACLVPRTHYTVQWVHAFTVITQNITKIRTRASV